MIKREILERLKPISDEEREILEGRAEINRSLYGESGGGVIRADALLSDSREIRVRMHTRFIRFPEHTHDYVEAVYMCSGSTTHIINGIELCLGEGELLFLGQNARQEILPAGEDDIAVNFIIRPSFFDKTLEMLGAEESPIKDFLLDSLLGKGNNGYLHFKVKEVLPVQNLIENLIWTLMSSTQNKRKINQTTMGLLFMHLLNHTDRLVYKSREDAAIMGIYRYIEENYKSGTLADAARLLHFDFFWLSHEIKARTGMTYTEHLQRKRLSQAAYLLTATRMSVEDVAAAVGYENKSYFHRIFLAHYGKTPKKFRDTAVGGK